MAVECPLARGVGTHQETQSFTRLHVDRVFVWTKVAVPVLELAPQPVEMNRMVHHAAVDQHDTHTLAEPEPDRLRLGKLLPVEAPDEALHVPGQMQLDL